MQSRSSAATAKREGQPDRSLENTKALTKSVSDLYGKVRAKFENATPLRQDEMVQSMNAVSAGMGDTFRRDKITFEGSLNDNEFTMKKLLDLFEEIAETEQVENETPLATEVEPEKPETAQ